MVNSLDLVIFDMDGVIIDSEYQYLKMQQEVIAKDGIVVNVEDLYPLVGLDWDLHFEYVLSFYTENKSHEEVKQAMFSHLDSVEVDYTKWVFDDVVDTVKRLHDMDIKIALASNSNHKVMVEVLKQLGIDKFFSKVSSAEFFEQGKPHPEIYEDVVRSLEVDPNRVLVIEDSMSGIQAAKDAGLRVFAIKDERFGIDQSKADDHISMVSDIFDK